MRFGLHVLLWIMLWYSAQQAYARVEVAIEEWLDPPEVEGLSEWDQSRMEKGVICDDGIFPYSSDPDWAPKCWKAI